MVSSKSTPLSGIDAHARVEIIGYVTDPKLVGYQILTNYESTYWRPLVGNDAWGLYEVLRSFCHEGDDTCFPSIKLLANILGLKERRVLTGWAKTVNQKRYEYQGLIETLQGHKLVIAEVKGKDHHSSYVFHVNLTPSLLTDEQLAQLPTTLQRRHEKLIKRCERELAALEAKRRPPKLPKDGSKKEESGEEVFSENFSEPLGNLPRGGGNLPRGGGNLPSEHYPYNNTQKTTVVVEKLKKHNIDASKARGLVEAYALDHVEEKITFLEWKLMLQESGQKRRGRPISDPAGWLIRAVEKDYKPPKAFYEYLEQLEEQAQLDGEGDEVQQLKLEEPQQKGRLAQLMEEYDTTQRETDLWKTTLGELALQMPRSTYDTWLSSTRLLALGENGGAVIAVANTMARDWLAHRLSPKIKQTLAGVAAQPVEELSFEALSSRSATSPDE